MSLDFRDRPFIRGHCQNWFFVMMNDVFNFYPSFCRLVDHIPTLLSWFCPRYCWGSFEVGLPSVVIRGCLTISLFEGGKNWGLYPRKVHIRYFRCRKILGALFRPHRKKKKSFFLRLSYTLFPLSFNMKKVNKKMMSSHARFWHISISTRNKTLL